MSRTSVSSLLVVLGSTFCFADNQADVSIWSAKTLSFHGPTTGESATPNPFTDYRLLVTFEHKDASYTVRGFYAADGNAAETSAEAGNIWRVRFSPDRPGRWEYSATMRSGKDIAISDDPSAGRKLPLDEPLGAFTAKPLHKAASRDFRNRGRIVADGRYLRFGKDGARFLKGGADSPENLLAFAGFDGTFRISTKTTDGEAQAPEELHQYDPHVMDWSPGDPTWKAGQGKGLVGAMNYLASTGMNAVYFLTLNIEGDGKDVWPYASPKDFTRFDCSKLDQWEIVFEHMQRKGILMHVVTQETENERMLDDGDTGRLRRLYYQELIARFAHHPALVWNLGEENGPADFSPNGQTAEQQKAMADYLKATDPYQHPVVIHTHSTAKGKEDVIKPLLGHPTLDGLSFQVDKPDRVHHEVAHWLDLAEKSGRPWMIAMDEIGPWHTGTVPDSDDLDHTGLRRNVLWGSLFAGASGVEWYFGAKFPHNDLTSEDLRQRDAIWRQTKHALDFFERHLPGYWEMRPTAEVCLTEGVLCFAKPGTTYALYVPGGTMAEDRPLQVSIEAGGRTFDISWFNPVVGGELTRGTVARIDPGETNVGHPAKDLDDDWVALIVAR